MEQDTEQTSCLQPIAKCLKVLKFVGGFPISVEKSKIISSRGQIWKLLLHYFIVLTTVHIFSFVGVFLPEPRSKSYKTFQGVITLWQCV